MNPKIRTSLLCGILSTLAMVGCNGGSSDNDKLAQIVELFTDDLSVVVGDDVDLTIQFSFSHDIVVDQNNNVIVIARIPNGLLFEADTARVEQIAGSKNVDPTIEECANGDSFLTFNLGQNLLENASNPDGLSDGKLIMALRGERGGQSTIEAAAGYDFNSVSGSCTGGIAAQGAQVFTVL